MENFAENELILKLLVDTTYSELSDSGSSSSFSTSSDDEFAPPPKRKKLTRSENYVEHVVHRYSDDEFKAHFRMNPSTAYKIIDLLKDSQHIPSHKDGRGKISAEKAFLIALWYLSNDETFREVSDRFNVTLSSVHRSLNRVLQFLLSLKTVVIRWPTDKEMSVITEAFRLKKGIENVIGCIDGSHIEISKPQENQLAYVNRKGYHSLLLQVIVGPNKKFLDVYCGEPGSMHDARLLRKSNIYKTIHDNPNVIGDKIVIGDTAYPNLNWLVTPFKDYGNLTNDHKQFNYKLSATRVVVENALGLLKGRFRRLRKLDNIDNNMCSKIIMGTCVLHNICVDEKDFIDTDITDFNQPVQVNCINNFSTNILEQGNVSRQNQIFNSMYN
ncbi:hypothetical protein RI129_002966 [Pyrocoelia pectoralis]|uniref:Nuclease HARBI1 n=1 Tax=Pyrocoelia pectoralis TaxID=417401 RepID=A0AAN7VPU2_9COLE